MVGVTVLAIQVALLLHLKNFNYVVHMEQNNFKTLEVYDIIFSMAKHVHNIFEFDSFSIYDYDDLVCEHDFKIKIHENIYAIKSKFNQPICLKFYNHVLKNTSTFIQYFYLRSEYKRKSTKENLERMIQNSVNFKSACCYDYAVIMCSILNKLLPSEYQKSLMINGGIKDDHAVIFLKIYNEIFVIDLWAKHLFKNQFGLICKYEDYVKHASRLGIMKHFDLVPLPEVTTLSKSLDLRYLLKI